MFFWSPFAAAVLANIVFFVLAPYSTSAGASRLDYAVMGLTIMMVVFGITYPIRTVGLWSYFRSRMHRINFFINTLFAVTLIAFIVVASGVFLGAGTSVNSFAYGISLIFELFFTIAYFEFSGSVWHLEPRGNKTVVFGSTGLVLIKTSLDKIRSGLVPL
jgi:hypothetical protein